jgi:Lrp/AsnC family leucine-responsive transcriptional regulator
VKKLEHQKVIEKYVAIINKNKIEKSFLVFCHIKLIQHSKEHVTTFEREVLKLEEVSECFHVSGDYDYILKVYVKDMDAYRDFVVTKLTAIKYIGSTHSTFVIEQVKNNTAINL